MVPNGRLFIHEQITQIIRTYFAPEHFGIIKYFDTFNANFTAMKKVTFVLFMLASSVVGFSQEWKSNLNEAFREASISGKHILLLFSVAENCESCSKLDRNVLHSEEFRSYVQENFVLVKQDFNSGKADNSEENLRIVEKYNKDGFFPLMVIINKNEKVVGQLGTYNNESPKQYIAKLQSVNRS